MHNMGALFKAGCLKYLSIAHSVQIILAGLLNSKVLAIGAELTVL